MKTFHSDVQVEKHGKKRTKFTRKNRETKLLLNFNEGHRRDFLTGFRRRKKERQEYYKEKLENKIKEEKKEFRKETKEFISKAHLEPSIVPEVEDLIQPTVIYLPKHTVTIVDITEVDFSGGCGLRLGKNMTNERTEDYTIQSDSQTKDVKDLTKKKNAVKKRLEHIKILEEKHKMIVNKIEKKSKRRKMRGKKTKKGSKKKGKQKK